MPRSHGFKPPDKGTPSPSPNRKVPGMKLGRRQCMVVKGDVGHGGGSAEADYDSEPDPDDSDDEHPNVITLDLVPKL